MTPRRVPGTPLERPKRRQEHPQRRQERPKRRQEHLGGTPERSWEPPSAPDGAQRPPEAPREASRSHFGKILSGFWQGFRIIFDPPPRLPLDLLQFSSSLSVPTAKHNNAMNKTRHEAQQGKAEQQSRSAPRHTPKRRASQAKRLARTSSSASVRTNTATANSGRTLPQQLPPPPSNASSGDAACIFSVFALSVPVLTQV